MTKKLLNYIFIFFIFCSCNSQTGNNKENNSNKDSITQKDTSINTVENQKPYTKPPIINIMDTLSTKKIVLVIKDSAATQERISIKLAEIYEKKLPEIIKKQGLKIVGLPMAWYQSQKGPIFFEAGFPVDKMPSKLTAQLKIKEIGIDSIIVVKFYGPYYLTSIAYDAIKDKLKSEKRNFIGAPYEIYVTDPIDKDGKPLDPYKVQTDIVFPRK